MMRVFAICKSIMRGAWTPNAGRYWRHAGRDAMIKAAQRGINAEKTTINNRSGRDICGKLKYAAIAAKVQVLHVMNKRSLVVEIKDAKMLLFLR